MLIPVHINAKLDKEVHKNSTKFMFSNNYVQIFEYLPLKCFEGLIKLLLFK